MTFPGNHDWCEPCKRLINYPPPQIINGTIFSKIKIYKEKTGKLLLKVEDKTDEKLQKKTNSKGKKVKEYRGRRSKELGY